MKHVAHVCSFEKNGRPMIAWDNAKDIKLGDKLYVATKEPLEYWSVADGWVYANDTSQVGTSKEVNWEPIYTAPPKREWVGLTADEIWKCNKAKSGSAVEFHICVEHQNVLDFAESIEAKLKEKNT
jgi:hypothetical protein